MIPWRYLLNWSFKHSEEWDIKDNFDTPPSENTDEAIADDDDDVVFENEDLRTTQALQQEVEGLTTLVSSLSTTVNEQGGKMIEEGEEGENADNIAENAADENVDKEEDELRMKEMERLKMLAKNVRRVYIKRKTPTIITPEVTKSISEEVPKIIPESTQETSKVILESTPEIPKVSQQSTPKVTKSTPEVIESTQDMPSHVPKATTPLRKKSIAKRKLKRSEEVITPYPIKYKVLYDSIDTRELDDRCLERMTYLFEHGHKWSDMFMYDRMIEDYVKEIKSKMSPDELEKDKLVFYVKANNYKSKQLKNMKIEKLRNLVHQIKKEKAKSSVKVVQPEIVVQQGQKPSQVFPEEDEKERQDLIREFMALGYKRDLIHNFTKDMLLDMKNKLNASREEK
ncbi:hypothetical protein L1987_06935 [Smallanthus sonchifolius]|uniref:Uncharacterized protein n=1 Tax=Smallanthus sonchifolius TaxID=185202 RepID=A0ACB9JZK4_9ASTR|nr:hypothetical protein L1987_06935 [Smallanthus sonchifolius]